MTTSSPACRHSAAWSNSRTIWAENAEVIEFLRGLGVDYAQGYGVSQPQRVQRAAIA